MKKFINFAVLLFVIMTFNSCATKQEFITVETIKQKNKNWIYEVKLIDVKDDEYSTRLKLNRFNKDGINDKSYGAMKHINKPPLGIKTDLNSKNFVLDQIFFDSFNRAYIVATKIKDKTSVVVWKYSKTGKADLSYGKHKDRNYIEISGLCGDITKRRIVLSKDDGFYFICSGLIKDKDVVYIRKYTIDGLLDKRYDNDGLMILKEQK